MSKIYKKTIVVWSEEEGWGDKALDLLKRFTAPIRAYGLEEVVVEPGDDEYDDEIADSFSG